jgi:hypothetical protein
LVDDEVVAETEMRFSPVCGLSKLELRSASEEGLFDFVSKPRFGLLRSFLPGASAEL